MASVALRFWNYLYVISVKALWWAFPLAIAGEVNIGLVGRLLLKLDYPTELSRQDPQARWHLIHCNYVDYLSVPY